MAETFGEADVILRVRLDELQKQLDQSEQMVVASTEKVAQAQAQASREVAQANESSGASLAAMGIAAAHAYGWWRTLGKAVTGVRIGLMAIPAVAATAAAAISAVAVGSVVALTLGVGLLADGMLRVKDSAGEMIEAFRGLDGSKQKALEFADALDRIPIIGGAARQVFEMFSQDAGRSTEAWTRLVATIEDGQVKVGLLGRAINGLVNISGVGIVARLLGFDTDLVGQINEANEAIERMNQLLAVRGQAAPIAAQIGGEAGGAARSAERDAELAGLEGVERIRAEERHRMEDAMRSFDALQRRSNEFHAQQRAQIEARAEEEGLGARRTQELLDAAAQAARQRDANIQMQREATAKALEQAAQTRVRLAQEEQAEQEELRRLEEQRTQAAAQSQREGLVAGAAAALASAGGDEFEAQRIELEAARQRALRDLMIEGKDELLQVTEDYYDARQQLIDAREREQMQRDKEIADKKAEAEAKLRERELEQEEEREFRTQQTNDRLRSQILQNKLEAAGKELEAQEEAIRQRFQEMIDQMERDGNKVGADLAAKLRDQEIAALEQDEEVGRALDVSQARIQAGTDGPPGRKKIEVEGQDKVLAKMEEGNRILIRIEKGQGFA